jgi:hypothetical protein
LGQWQNWNSWRVSYQDIESWTGVKFKFIFESSLTSPLLADSEGNLGIGINSFNRSVDSLEFLQDHATPLLDVFPRTFSPNRLLVEQFDKRSIPPNTNMQAQSFLVAKTSSSPLEIGIFKNYSNSFSTIESYLPHVGSSENGSAEGGIGEINSKQNSILKVTIDDSSTRKVNIAEISTPKDTTFQGVTKLSISGVKEVGGQQFIISNPTQIQPTEIQSTEVSLPSLVSSQQLFSGNLSHDNTSLLTSIYSTAQTLWHTNTDLNLNFTITNLPTGQLAEATITGYDTSGRPNTATISIDTDANGVGWFIDPTPQDNSEFRAGTGTYFTAAPNSAAAGKYDLLTAILHEMGHTLGFINGYSEFDKYVRNNKFVTASGTEITLTPDGSHLDRSIASSQTFNPA